MRSAIKFEFQQPRSQKNKNKNSNFHAWDMRGYPSHAQDIITDSPVSPARFSLLAHWTSRTCCGHAADMLALNTPDDSKRNFIQISVASNAGSVSELRFSSHRPHRSSFQISSICSRNLSMTPQWCVDAIRTSGAVYTTWIGVSSWRKDSTPPSK